MFTQPRKWDTPLTGWAVEFSPFQDTWIAVGTSQHFGIVGNGQQTVFEMSADGHSMTQMRAFDTQHGIYDCAWNELNEFQLVSVCSDGSMKLWDLKTRDNFPIQHAPNAHEKEIASVHWNQVSIRHLHVV